MGDKNIKKISKKANWYVLFEEKQIVFKSDEAKDMKDDNPGVFLFTIMNAGNNLTIEKNPTASIESIAASVWRKDYKHNEAMHEVGGAVSVLMSKINTFFKNNGQKNCISGEKGYYRFLLPGWRWSIGKAEIVKNDYCIDVNDEEQQTNDKPSASIREWVEIQTQKMIKSLNSRNELVDSKSLSCQRFAFKQRDDIDKLILQYPYIQYYQKKDSFGNESDESRLVFIAQRIALHFFALESVLFNLPYSDALLLLHYRKEILSWDSFQFAYEHCPWLFKLTLTMDKAQPIVTVRQ